MTKGVFNWNYNEVVAILKDNGFRLNHIEGSHHFYTGYIDARMHQVCVPRHGKQTFKPRTLKSMIVQSGLSRKVWGL